MGSLVRRSAIVGLLGQFSVVFPTEPTARLRDLFSGVVLAILPRRRRIYTHPEQESEMNIVCSLFFQIQLPYPSIPLPSSPWWLGEFDRHHPVGRTDDGRTW